MVDKILEMYSDHVRHSGSYALDVIATNDDLIAGAARRHRRNACVLALESAGEEPRSERADDAAAPSAEIQRLDAKLNVALELLSHVIERDLEFPPRFDVRFNAHGIEWRSDAIAVEGMQLLLRLHLDSCPALPLELAARGIASLQPGWAAALYTDMPPALEESFARFVFRAHRREIALSSERS